MQDRDPKSQDCALPASGVIVGTDVQNVVQAAREAVAAVGVMDPGHLGAVMRILMPRLQGQAEGSLVYRVVKERLGTR